MLLAPLQDAIGHSWSTKSQTGFRPKSREMNSLLSHRTWCIFSAPREYSMRCMRMHTSVCAWRKAILAASYNRRSHLISFMLNRLNLHLAHTCKSNYRCQCTASSPDPQNWPGQSQMLALSSLCVGLQPSLGAQAREQNLQPWRILSPS